MLRDKLKKMLPVLPDLKDQRKRWSGLTHYRITFARASIISSAERVALVIAHPRPRTE